MVEKRDGNNRSKKIKYPPINLPAFLFSESFPPSWRVVAVLVLALALRLAFVLLLVVVFVFGVCVLADCMTWLVNLGYTCIGPRIFWRRTEVQLLLKEYPFFFLFALPVQRKRHLRNMKLKKEGSTRIFAESRRNSKPRKTVGI